MKAKKKTPGLIKHEDLVVGVRVLGPVVGGQLLPYVLSLKLDVVGGDVDRWGEREVQREVQRGTEIEKDKEKKDRGRRNVREGERDRQGQTEKEK